MSPADIEALRIEREGYVRRGLTDRVKQIDALLRKAGVTDKEPVADVETAVTAPEAERAVVSRVSKRKGN